MDSRVIFMLIMVEQQCRYGINIFHIYAMDGGAALFWESDDYAAGGGDSRDS